MNIGELITKYSQMFESISMSPRLDAEILLRKVLGDVDRMYILMNLDKKLDEKEIEAFEKLASQRLQSRPVAYIVGKREFMGLDFNVREGVLIPRPDTEILVERTIELIDDVEKRIKDTNADDCNNEARRIKMLDIGTGSGAISVSIKHYRNGVDVKAVDISDEALEIAKENSERLVDGSVEFLKSDVFENVDEKFDIIVSNPPYINPSERTSLDSQVVDYEPENALFAENEGLYFYRKITEESGEYLKEKGILIFETGHDQSEAVAEIMKKNGFSNIEVHKDLQGFGRVVEGVKK